MLFNSLEFLAFLTIVYALYRLLPFRPQNYLLLAASYLFYGWWDLRFLFLLVLSTTIDFAVALMVHTGTMTRAERLRATAMLLAACVGFVLINWSAVEVGGGGRGIAVDWGHLFTGERYAWWVFAGTLGLLAFAHLAYPWLSRMEEERRRYLFLWVTVLANLGILGFFKYFNFFADSLEAALSSVGVATTNLHLRIILPVGVSFYTFQALSYTIDVYRKRMAPTRRLLDYALFVAFFPQLVAGPIERACELLPRISGPRTVTYEQTAEGLFLILFGLFKKIAIADGVAGSVAAVYSSTGYVSAADVALGTVLFAIQIYCDFSAYSDIARGCAKLLGTELMLNFNLPFFSRNPSDFWRRWHISLSSWLRDYLYIPLGGNRGGVKKTYRNLMLTMAIGGLWHGAAWNYVLWGCYQGGLLCGHRLLVGPEPKRGEEKAPRRAWWAPFVNAFTIGFFFLFVLYGWLLFRANSAAQVGAFTHKLLTGFRDLSVSLPKPTFSAILGVAVLGVYELIQYNTGRLDIHARWPAPVRGLFYAALITLCLMGTSNAPAQFIYFQF
jgi:D-alanyl-lipoteichoic acid acyltransferase DltB (MBOAT superfamily)